MSERFRTPQEEFWAGAFGDEYAARNQGERWVASNMALFSRILTRCHGVSSAIEFGANVGNNLKALRALLPKLELTALEINPQAVARLRQEGDAQHVEHASMLDYDGGRTWDLALVKGVLVHIHPDFLPRAYAALHRACGRYLVLVEYYNPTPVEVEYRGHAGRLFKRDFAGELLDAYPDLRLLDYGFVWRRDPAFPQDDCTWFVLERVAR
jgi:pseudaminic acid biosynthesis-associated methylase